MYLIILKKAVPTTDVLNYGCEKLIRMLGNRFPKINAKINFKNLGKNSVLAIN